MHILLILSLLSPHLNCIQVHRLWSVSQWYHPSRHHTLSCCNMVYLKGNNLYSLLHPEWHPFELVFTYSGFTVSASCLHKHPEWQEIYYKLYTYICVYVCVIKYLFVTVLYSCHPKSEMLVHNTLIWQCKRLRRPSEIYPEFEEIWGDI